MANERFSSLNNQIIRDPVNQINENHTHSDLIELLTRLRLTKNVCYKVTISSYFLLKIHVDYRSRYSDKPHMVFLTKTFVVTVISTRQSKT